MRSRRCHVGQHTRPLASPLASPRARPHAGLRVALSLALSLAPPLACSPAPSLRPGPPPSAAPEPSGEADVAASASASAAPAALSSVGPAEPFSPFGPDPVREKPGDPGDLCEVAASNIDRAVEAVLSRKAPAPAPGAAATPWDRKKPLEHARLVESRLALTQAEKARLARDGLLALDRMPYASFAHAMHDVYQSQLPVYVSVDALFHAVFRSHEVLLATLEEERLLPSLERALAKMHEALSPGPYPPETAADLDVYLTVARSLIEEREVPSRLGSATQAEAKALIDKARDAKAIEQVDLFGRPRLIDFSQFLPRGHYALPEHASWGPRYLRGATWASRLELNLVSRSSRSAAPGASPDPRETPREATLALAFADLASRSGADADVALVDRAFQLLGGKREDVSIAQIASLRKQANITDLASPDAFDRLKAAIGPAFARRARMHPMPQGSAELPVIATLIGPRASPDLFAMRHLVHGEVSERYELGAADMAYALGNDRALSALSPDIRRHPELPAALDRARASLRSELTGDDLLSTWMKAVAALAEKPEGQRPSFAATEAFADMRLASTVAAYGQLRHGNVLLSGRGYDEGGCEIPDGYVEPAPAALDGIVAFYEASRRALAAIAPDGSLASLDARLARSARIVRALRAVVEVELSGAPLEPEHRRLLATVAEIVPASSDSPPLYTGWYFQLFPRARDALREAGFVADFYASTNTGRVTYAGSGAPRLALFVIDTGGAPRLMAGPVARPFEVRSPLASPVTDEQASKIKGASAPWDRSFALPSRPEPDVTLLRSPDEGGLRFQAVSKQAQGPITVELLGHHLQVCSRGSGVVGRDPPAIVMREVAKGDGCGDGGGLRIRVGGASFERISSYASYGATFGEQQEPP